MPKAKIIKNFKYLKNAKNPKIEVDNYTSLPVPTYSELNAFMLPSKISPMYQGDSNDSNEPAENGDVYENENVSDSDSESDSNTDNDNESLSSLYGVEPDDEHEPIPRPDDESVAAENPDDIDIAESDKNIYNMKCILEKKKQLLLEKNREIKNLAKQNSFLNKVLSDYEKIKLHILEEKKKQQSAIKIISRHISQISKNMNQEDYHIEQLQDDQSMLLEELEKIKMEMNEVMRS
jgi:hypothetical protein